MDVFHFPCMKSALSALIEVWRYPGWGMLCLGERSPGQRGQRKTGAKCQKQCMSIFFPHLNISFNSVSKALTSNSFLSNRSSHTGSSDADVVRKADKSLRTVKRRKVVWLGLSEAAHFSDLSSGDISSLNGRNENTERKKCSKQINAAFQLLVSWWIWVVGLSLLSFQTANNRRDRWESNTDQLSVPFYVIALFKNWPMQSWEMQLAGRVIRMHTRGLVMKVKFCACNWIKMLSLLICRLCKILVTWKVIYRCILLSYVQHTQYVALKEIAYCDFSLETEGFYTYVR